MNGRTYAELVADDSVCMDTLTGFQKILARCPTPADRKGLIIDAHGYGALGLTETRLLIEAYQLETA